MCFFCFLRFSSLRRFLGPTLSHGDGLRDAVDAASMSLPSWESPTGTGGGGGGARAVHVKARDCGENFGVAGGFGGGDAGALGDHFDERAALLPN